MAFGWIRSGSGVQVPATFWHPELVVPQRYGRVEGVTETALLESYARLLAEEETGQVSRATIINTLLAAWELRRVGLWRQKDENIRNLVTVQVPLLARKYGLSRLWRAAYYDTMQRRLDEQLDDDTPLDRRYHCGRCGREIWAKLSVRRGIGPVCWHKRDA